MLTLLICIAAFSMAPVEVQVISVDKVFNYATSLWMLAVNMHAGKVML